MKNINILYIVFKQHVSAVELSFFRGAVIHAMEGSSLLFHNHQEEGLRYKYPLIQYRRIEGHAAIVGIEDGVEALMEWLQGCDPVMHIGNRVVRLEVEHIHADSVGVGIDEGMHTYSIDQWLPLSQSNHAIYQQLEGVVERYSMLERMLVGNILSFAKSIGVMFESEVKASLTSVSSPRTVPYKRVPMLSFSAQFRSNVILPAQVGLGKGVSLDHGVLTCLN